LLAAAVNGHVEILRLLLAKGADMNVQKQARAWSSASSLCAAKHQLGLCTALFCSETAALGVLRCAQDGITAMYGAAATGQVECLRMLLEAGANKETPDSVRAGGAAGCVTDRRAVSVVDFTRG
jgi:ankyrin repeat protein